MENEETLMNAPIASPLASDTSQFLYGRGAAWFAYVMTVALMIFDYVDRQIVVSMFPFLKVQWDLSDKELGALVSVISVTVAVFGIPVALIADRFSRVKSIVAMAVVWSIACISCMFAQSYSHLLTARAVVGLGEAGYGSVGAAMVATHFPQRMRGGLLGGFFASASIGSVLGVILGGVIATRWGWQAAFGIVGIPGLIVAILYLFVRDYETVKTAPANMSAMAGATALPSRGEMVWSIFRSRTVRWVCIGAAAQLITLSALWSWLPSYLNRTYGVAPDRAGIQAALVLLAGAAGSVVLGAVVDRAGVRRPEGKFTAIACLSILTMVTLMLAFGGARLGIAFTAESQFILILFGGFLATCTVGPAAAIVIEVVHPGVRSTGASVLSLSQNLLGLAAGPLIAGMISDLVGLQAALMLTPLSCIVAAMSFLRARPCYRNERTSLDLIPVLRQTNGPSSLGYHPTGLRQ
jgi:MFS transporter, Spinster family, sphingosine-1-phosphate transporter